jgi:DnaJ like chaperone protein
MGSIKWIAGFLGWVMVGPIGGLIGFLLGSAAESGLGMAQRMSDGQQPGAGSYRQQGGYRQGSYQQRPGGGYYSATEQRNSFLVSLLVLSSAVVKADGRVHESEAMRILEGLNRQQVNIYEVGTQISAYMNYSQRLQLFHYLAQIANADGDFSKTEKDVLETIAAAIRLNASDAASVIAMFYKDTASAYAVLEISPSATDEEVKSAYRRMAMKHHPDKVATLGPDVQKAAEEKFRQIQQAYETIKKQRGLN